jgi:hypothetical protein
MENQTNNVVPRGPIRWEMVMLVCAKCKQEMTCQKNGVGIRYTETGEHVYWGDLYWCKKCGSETVHCNSQPSQDTNLTRLTKDDIFMNNTAERAKEIVDERERRILRNTQ